ncbi:MAG: TonB-dependent receptor, partial [Asticcacaulis sp.]
MTLSNRAGLASASVFVIAAALAGGAHANDAAAPAADPAATPASDEPVEVIVTAEYRKTSLQKTPIAVSVITADTLRAKAVENLRDATTRVPGLFIAPSALTYSTGSYYIRGIGETDSIANQTVGTYIDDVYISRPIGGTFDFNDVQDVQVLRGPQGTLYGRNSSAGAIKITTKLPDDTPTGFAELSVGDHEASIERGGISGPLVEGKLSGSIAVVKRYRQGLVYDRTLNDYVGTIDTLGTRAKLNWTPTAKSAYLLTLESFDDKGDPTPLVPRLQPGGVIDPNVNYSDTQIQNHTKLTAASLRATWTLSDKSILKFIVSERQFKQPGWYDQDGSAAKINVTYSDHRDIDWTQELQYLYNGERIHAVFGLFALYDDFRSYRTNYSPLAIAALLPDRTYLQDSGEKTKNYSAYGQVTYDLTPRLHLIAGERYTYEAHNFIFTGNEQNAAKQYLTTLYTITKPYQHWTSFTPKLGLNYELTNTVASYLTYAQGFKAGGFDGRASSKAAAGLPYDPENVTTWEAGFKGDFFGHALRTNIAVYHNLIEGYQASVLDENNITHRINLGRVRTQGFELETHWRVIEGLSWQNNVSLLDSKVLTAG